MPDAKQGQCEAEDFDSQNSHLRPQIAIFDLSFLLSFQVGIVRWTAFNLTIREKRMGNNFEDARTKPTIETVIERINALGDNLQGQLDVLHVNVGSLKSDINSLKSDVGSIKSEVGALRDELQLYRGEMEIRIDRIEGIAN